MNVRPSSRLSALNVNSVSRMDPTRTTQLRLRFVRRMNRLFGELKRDVRVSVVDRDCFGTQPDVFHVLAPTPTKAFDFARVSDKIAGFMTWLEKQESAGVLETIIRPGRIGVESAWTDVYIDTAYARGMRRGRAELRRAGYNVPLFEQVPGGVGAAMNAPLHADRVGVLYTRAFEDLKSVTNVMNAQIRRRIADGLTTGLSVGIAEGKNPRVIARELFKNAADRIDKIGVTRARMIARTEVVRAHNVALIQEYRQADAEMGVTVVAEWSTAGYGVCPICADFETGGPYTLDQIEMMIPAHPNCRCVALPVVKRTRMKEGMTV